MRLRARIPAPPRGAPAVRTAAHAGSPPQRAKAPGGWRADRPAGYANQDETERGDAGRRETSGIFFQTFAGLPASRGGRTSVSGGVRHPFWRHGSSRRHRPRTCGPVGPPAPPPARERAPRQANMSGLVRTGPRSEPGSGWSWAPNRDGLRPHPETALCRAQRPRRWRPGHRRGTAPPPNEPLRPVTEDAPPVGPGGERVGCRTLHLLCQVSDCHQNGMRYANQE